MKAVILLLLFVIVSVSASSETETATENEFTFETFCASFVNDEQNACEDLKAIVATLPACTDDLRDKIVETFGPDAPQVAEIVCFKDDSSENLFTRNAVFDSLAGGYMMYLLENSIKN